MYYNIKTKTMQLHINTTKTINLSREEVQKAIITFIKNKREEILPSKGEIIVDIYETDNDSQIAAQVTFKEINDLKYT